MKNYLVNPHPNDEIWSFRERLAKRMEGELWQPYHRAIAQEQPKRKYRPPLGDDPGTMG